MGGAVGKFAEWTIFGGYFGIILTLALVSWPLLPDAIEWVQIVVGQLTPAVVMDFVADLSREPDTRTLMIGLATAAGLITLIVIGAGFEAFPGMIWWEITIFKRIVGEHRSLLDGYVQCSIPQLRDDYNKLADPAERVTLVNWRRNRNLRLGYHRITDAFTGAVCKEAWANSSWYTKKEQTSRIFRTLAFITYITVAIAILLHTLAFVIAIILQEATFSTWQYFLALFLIGIIYTDFIGRIMRRALTSLWRSMFMLLYLLHERQRSEQLHNNELSSRN